MFVKVVFLASVIALTHGGLLLGEGLGGGIGIGLGGGVGGGLGGGLGGGYGLELGGGGGGYGKGIIDYYAPPKYEYKYIVHDPHTGDLKEKTEERIGDLTKTQYAWAEKDRKVAEARVIATSGKVQILGKY